MVNRRLKGVRPFLDRQRQIVLLRSDVVEVSNRSLILKHRINDFKHRVKDMLNQKSIQVVPIGAMFAMTLWLGSSAYLYISVAFAQMLKAISNPQ